MRKIEDESRTYRMRVSVHTMRLSDAMTPMDPPIHWLCRSLCRILGRLKSNVNKNIKKKMGITIIPEFITSKLTR